MARIYTEQGLVSETFDFQAVDPHFNQLFVAFNYFSDEALTIPVTPTAGTITVEGRPNGAGGFEELDSSPVDCTDTASVTSTNVPLDSVRCTPVGLTGATHYKATITAKEY